MKIENILWQFSWPFADNEICQFQLCPATDHAHQRTAPTMPQAIEMSATQIVKSPLAPQQQQKKKEKAK